MKRALQMATDVVAAKVKGRLIRRMLQLVMVAGAVAGAYASAQVVAKGLSRGDEDTDDFSFMTIMTGKDLTIGASPFRYGSVMTLLGRTRIDLRQATLDPKGAHLDLVTSFARVEVVVPEGWAVEIKQVSLGLLSELAVEAGDPEALPDGAPKLSILADTRWGCGSIKADAPTEPS